MGVLIVEFWGPVVHEHWVYPLPIVVTCRSITPGGSCGRNDIDTSQQSKVGVWQWRYDMCIYVFCVYGCDICMCFSVMIGLYITIQYNKKGRWGQAPTYDTSHPPPNPLPHPIPTPPPPIPTPPPPPPPITIANDVRIYVNN